MQYIKVRFRIAGVAYQEISGGSVQRYLDENGDELFRDPPIGDGCRVIDAAPAAQPWMSLDSVPAFSDAVKAKVLATATKGELQAAIDVKIAVIAEPI